MAILLAECASSTRGGSPAPDGGAGAEAAAPDDGAGIEAGTSVEASAATCALPPSGLMIDEGCTACLQQSCCDAVSQCFDDPTCVGIDACLTTCFAGVAPEGGLTACEEQCRPDASGATGMAVDAELACFMGVCSSACPGAPLCGTPTGSYAQTCNRCQLVGAMLTCECANQAGAAVVTSLDLCGCGQPPAIANVDGALTCAPPDAGEGD
jgi:hypothetical protein